MNRWPVKTAELLALVRSRRPMIHHITNTVVTNFTANVTLCLGAAPVMASCRAEVEEMVAMAGCLLLNIGTLDEAQVESMHLAGRRANALGIPVVLDPVGAGATRLRTQAAESLLREVRVSVLRGNAGEILTLAGEGGKVRGVDSQEQAGPRDAVLRAFSARAGLTVAVTGEVDLITDGKRTFRVSNGHPRMGQVTGTGCAATTVVAGFLAVHPEDPAVASACALAAFGLAGELAAMTAQGPGGFVPQLLDSLAALDDKALRQGVRLEVT